MSEVKQVDATSNVEGGKGGVDLDQASLNGSIVGSEKGSKSASEPDLTPPDIEVDLQLFDHSHLDSALGGIPESSTVSLSESVYDYIEENGRTYHAFHAGKYSLPNDEPEQERLDGKLHLAPISNPKRVLDIATGTGIWAIDFAQRNPLSNVLGTDLSPIQPEFIPPNCTFEIDDAEEEWLYSHPFDFIHGRAIQLCFKSPPLFLTKVLANLVPGGYFEVQDPIMPLKSLDDTLKGTSLDEFQRAVMRGAEKLGRPWTKSKRYGRWMREAGFVDVQERAFCWATNGWVKGRKEKDLARLAGEDLKRGLPSFGLMVLTRGLGWNVKRTEKLIEDATRDIRDPAIHAYAEMYVCYGRKPLA